MIEIKTYFFTAEAAALFAALGFTVEERDTVIHSGSESWAARRWMIRDATGNWRELETVFREAMEQRLKNLLTAGITRADIIQTFNN